MNWYYVSAGRQAGPVEEAQLEDLFRTGKIQAETLVWKEGMANWQPYREVKPVTAQSVEPSPEPCSPPVIGVPAGTVFCSVPIATVSIEVSMPTVTIWGYHVNGGCDENC